MSILSTCISCHTVGILTLISLEMKSETFMTMKYDSVAMFALSTVI